MLRWVDRKVIIIGMALIIILIASMYLVFFQPKEAEKPPIPIVPTTRSNSWMTDPVSLEDFLPFGKALVRLPDNRLVINHSEGWTASNFVAFGMLKDDAGNTLFFHPSINMGGSHGIRFTLNDENIYQYLPGDPYYDDTGKFFPYPTVYTNPKNRFITAFAYDEGSRTWYVKIIDTKTSPPTEVFYIEGRAKLPPLWIGKAEGPYVVHGVAGVYKGWLMLDVWGGYLDFLEVIEARFNDIRTGKVYNFTEGFFFMDREYHRILPVSKLNIVNGKIVDGVEFDAMSFHKMSGERIEFIFIRAVNPLPNDLKEKVKFPEFERFGRINFVYRGESYRLDDYKFWTDGKLQPKFYFLRGNITDSDGNVVGEVDLKAEALAYWGFGGAYNWKVGKSWWDPDVSTAWGRSYVRWSGTVTLRNETIIVDNVIGFGEFLRYG